MFQFYQPLLTVSVGSGQVFADLRVCYVKTSGTRRDSLAQALARRFAAF